MLKQFLVQQSSYDLLVKEIQLQVTMKYNIIIQVFERTFCIYMGDTFYKNQTQYDLMGCSIMSPQLIYIFSLQGILEWDLIKNQERNFIRTEEIFCGDAQSGMICSAHNKTVMVWESRTKAAINLILAHSMQITSCLFDATTKYMVTTGQDNYCRILHSYYPECLKTIYLNKIDHTLHAQFTNDSKHILVSTADQPLSLWNWSQSLILGCYSDDMIKNQRYYLSPGILYERNIPKNIIQSSDDGLICKYDFTKPDKQAQQIQRIQDDIPVRFVLDNSKICTFNPNQSQIIIYNII